MVANKHAIEDELRQLNKEQSEMNEQQLEECKRCHSAIRSNTFIYDANRAVILYKSPTWCSVCNSVHWREEDIKEDFLPTEKDGVLCQCNFPGCGQQFWNRPEWLKEQQRAAKRGNPWMPTLIDEDPERLKRLEENTELAPK